jgi:Polyketide cyclase / dehydrase and lipid transport
LRSASSLCNIARSIEGSSRSSASVDDVWAVWTDPAGWLGGPVEAAELHGAFEVGSKYTTKVRGYPPETATITRMEPPRLWTSVGGRPRLTITVEHLIEPADDETLITERWIMSGPLATPVALVLGWRIRSALAAGTAHFARLAEARAPA